MTYYDSALSESSSANEQHSSWVSLVALLKLIAVIESAIIKAIFMAAASGKTHYSEDVIDKVLVKGAQERL